MYLSKEDFRKTQNKIWWNIQEYNEKPNHTLQSIRNKDKMVICNDLLLLYNSSRENSIYWTDCSIKTYEDTYAIRSTSTKYTFDNFALQEYIFIKNLIRGKTRGIKRFAEEFDLTQHYNEIIKDTDIELLFNEQAFLKIDFLDKLLMNQDYPKKIVFDDISYTYSLKSVINPNPYPKIFTGQDDKAYQLFNRFKKNYFLNIYLDVSFLYHMMKKDKFIDEYTSQKAFIDWVLPHIEFDNQKTPFRTKERLETFKNSKSDIRLRDYYRIKEELNQ